MLPYSIDHEQDKRAYPVDPYSAESTDHTYIQCIRLLIRNVLNLLYLGYSIRNAIEDETFELAWYFLGSKPIYKKPVRNIFCQKLVLLTSDPSSPKRSPVLHLTSNSSSSVISPKFPRGSPLKRSNKYTGDCFRFFVAGTRAKRVTTKRKCC